MRNASFMEKLLEGVEVKWEALGVVCHISSGGTPSTAKKEYWENGDIPWLKSESCNNESVYSSNNFITELGLKNSSTKILAKDTTLIALVGATIFKTAYLEFEATTNQNIASIKSKDSNVLSDKFVFYYLTNLYNDLKFKMRNYGMLNLSTLRQFKLPIPPLNIQTEIVRILDAFTSLTAELTAELTTRKKQYHYYRDQLLSFEDGEVEWKPMAEIGEFIRGKRFTKADYVDEGISVIHYGEIYTQYGVSTNHALSKVRTEMAASLRYAEPGDVVITDVGETVEDVGKAVAWLGNGKVAIHDHCYAFRHPMNPKFVSYCMQTTAFIAEKAKYVARTKVNTLLINGFSKIRIPIPPLEEQARIVAILDKFDVLTTSISEGLPREIELRQQQYAYYRDLLLSFPKADVEA